MKCVVHWNKKLLEQGQESANKLQSNAFAKGEILTNLESIHKVENHKIKTLQRR